MIQWAPPSFEKEEIESVSRVLKSKWLTQGKITDEFEKKIAEYVGAKHCVMVNNGTSALICSLLSHNIKPGDEVIVPSFTFVATVNAILSIGAKPILVDSNPLTFNTEIDLIKSYVTKKTKAIIPVDVSGMPVDIKKFREFSRSNNLILIEDAAEGIGAEFKNKKVGSFGHSTIFSFHMAKVITSVEGGCIVTNDKNIAEKLKLIRSHGSKVPYDSKSFGLNFRISELHSSIGLAQIKKIKNFLKHRNLIAKIYREEIKNYDFQHIPDYVTLHPYMLFGMLTHPKDRDRINKILNKNHIETRVCWPPVHMQQYHSKIFKTKKFKNAEEIYSRIINLPMGNGLDLSDVMCVVDIMKKVKNKFNSYAY